MADTFAVVAAGAMGAAIGARLSGHGARVLTSTLGRSEASVERAWAGGMEAVSDDELVTADVFLSVVPPDQAIGLAARIAQRASRLLVYVDLNAISPQTAGEVGGVLHACGAAFVDGGIIGPPPVRETAGPTLYLSGPTASCLDLLSRHGLVVKALDGGIGAASVLKMSYAGLTKELTALGATMILAATRNGAERALHAELANSQPELLARLGRAVPDMLPKAYRWALEMRKIAGFIGRDHPGSEIYEGVAKVYEEIAADKDRDRSITDALEAFLAKPTP